MRIKVYGGEFCPYCNMAKEFLDKNNIEYEYIDVQEDHKQARYMVEKTRQNGIPVIEIIDNNKSEFIIGFDKEKLRRRLNIK